MVSGTESTRDEQDTVEDWYGVEAPAGLSGIDLSDADACPVCDGTEGHAEGPAGYYRCLDCFTKWAGDYQNAELVAYFPDGRAA